MIVWPPKDPEEVRIATFDFTADLGSEPITPGSVVMSVSLLSGEADPDLVTMIYGAAQVQDGKVLQAMRNGLDGRDVKWRCKVATATQVLVLTAVLPVRSA